MPETPPTTPPAPGALTPPADPAAAPPTDPAADDDAAFTSDRQRRRFAELSGRVGVRERERDEARAHIEQLLVRSAERLASSSLSEPADLWHEGATVADLLTEDGSDVDPAKVTAIVDALVSKRPGLRKPPEVRPLSGIHGVQQAIPERPTLADAVRRVAAGRGGL